MPLARAIDRARTECRYILSATQIDRLFLLFSRVLGTSERISVADALYAVTIGAAFTLKLDTELGSIECGKRADFAILEDDPLSVDPARLDKVPVWGTVVGGRIFPCSERAGLRRIGARYKAPSEAEARGPVDMPLACRSTPPSRLMADECRPARERHDWGPNRRSRASGNPSILTDHEWAGWIPMAERSAFS